MINRYLKIIIFSFPFTIYRTLYHHVRLWKSERYRMQVVQIKDLWVGRCEKPENRIEIGTMRIYSSRCVQLARKHIYSARMLVVIATVLKPRVWPVVDEWPQQANSVFATRSAGGAIFARRINGKRSIWKIAECILIGVSLTPSKLCDWLRLS